MVKPQKVLSILNSLRGYREKLGQLAAIPEAKFLRDFTKVESANAAAATLRPTGQ